MPISSAELKPFLNRVFVECGSYAGQGIASALLAGFEEVHSVDIDPRHYKECMHTFRRDPRVHLALGDCGEWLETTLNQIGEPCTIYLDANGWPGETVSPFYSSVDAIVRHGGTQHIILTDDINSALRPRAELLRDLRGGAMVPSLRLINPEYRFYLIDTHNEDWSYTYPSWVLVADPVADRFPGMAAEEFV